MSLLTSIESLRVLVVEDSVLNQTLLKGLLAVRDCTVTVAVNGQEAVDELSKATFDLILMDVQMPVMDGLTATKLIRDQEDRGNRRTPIVAVTAGIDRQTCLDAGMDDHLSKPVRSALLDEILSQVRSAIGE